MDQNVPVATDFLRVVRDMMMRQYWPKLRSCVETLEPEQIRWRPPNAAVESVGELLDRLADSVGRAIEACRGIPEDSAKPETVMGQGIQAARPREALLATIQGELEELERILGHLDPGELTEMRTLHGRETTLMEIIMGVTEELATSYGAISHLASVLSDYKPICEY